MTKGKSVLAISLGAAVLTAGALLPRAASSQDQADDYGYGHCGGPGTMGGYGHRGWTSPGGWMGPGMMGTYGDHMGPGAFGGPGLGIFSRLDLSDSQRTQVNKIRDELRKKHWALMGKIADDRAKVRDLNSASEPDPKAVGAVYADVSKLRREMIEERIQAANQARALLTKEQRQQLDNWRQRSWSMAGRGLGMGRGPSRVE